MAERKFFSFYLDNDLFGIDIILVREILRRFDITPVDHAPEAISGVMNLRGQIVTLIDLRTKLGMKKEKRLPTPTAEKTEVNQAQQVESPPPGRHCIFLKTSGELARLADNSMADAAPDEYVGLVVGDVEEVYAVDTRFIEPPPANLRGVDAGYIESVVKLQNRLLMVIDSTRITQVENQ